MKIEKKLKSRKGFTLVELVVVIAVLAILAGVGGAAYSGYITKANEAADVSQLAAIKTAADAAAAADDNHFTVGKIVVTVDESSGNASSINITGTDTGEEINITLTNGKAPDGTEFATFMTGNTVTFKSDAYKKGANWTTANGWKKGTT